jgi:hypothetical protein
MQTAVLCQYPPPIGPSHSITGSSRDRGYLSDGLHLKAHRSRFEIVINTDLISVHSDLFNLYNVIILHSRSYQSKSHKLSRWRPLLTYFPVSKIDYDRVIPGQYQTKVRTAHVDLGP